MQLRIRIQDDWHKSLWKILGNPAIEVVVAIVLVLIAAWVLVGTDPFQSVNQQPVFGYK
jgi:hypothetical protein